jgi:glycosyltransferase involved in cell wall biosynthesis
LRRFDSIILMSRTQERFFLEAGVEPARIHVVPHGVDSEHFRPGAPERKPPPMGPMGRMRPIGPIFTVLAAGGYRRNFPLLREVCMHLKNEVAIRFEIVAPPAWRPMFDDLPNVRFRSGLDDAQFLEAYQTCSCLIQTAENSSANNVILEAMACGQPVVAERVGGIPEYVDPTCAILTTPGDADALVGALLELRASPARRDLLAAGARKRAEMLDWKNIAEQMRGIYERL